MGIFLKRWMLPLAITIGVGITLALSAVPSWEGALEGWDNFASKAQPSMIAIMLFLQFCEVSPRDIRFRKWHLEILLLQGILFAVFAVAASKCPSQTGKILLESAMLCLIAPTASAAGVITGKIGGSMSGVLSYLFLSNCLACIAIPLAVPFVHPETGADFLPTFLVILKKVFSLLLAPCALAWTIRLVAPKINSYLRKKVGWAFYMWGVSLTLAMSIATGSMLSSGIPPVTLCLIGAVSMVCCFAQFGMGRAVASRMGHCESVTAGQSMGQKNTGFIIWLGYTYLTPVTSVAGGLYSIWHNLFNSYQLGKAVDNKPSAATTPKRAVQRVKV